MTKSFLFLLPHTNQSYEGMSEAEISSTIASQSQKLGLPVTDALSRPAARLLALVLSAYPFLQQRLPVAAI